MRKYLCLISLALLAACGGGGGGSSLPPVPTTTATPVPQQKHALVATFQQGPISQTASRSTLITRPEVHTMQGLTGQLVPLTEFVRQDAYITGSFASDATTQAIALWDTTQQALPTPVPTVSWSETGNALPIDSPSPAPSPNPSATPGLIPLSSETVHTPSTLGMSTIGISSASQTANLTVDTYAGSGLQTGGQYGTVGLPSGLMFDITGTSEPSDTQADTDLYIDTTVTPNLLVFPYGAISEGKALLSAMTTVDSHLGSVKTTVSLDPTTITNAPSWEYRTHDGRVGKFRVTIMATQSTGTCDYVYGGYGIATGGTFSW